MADYGPEYNNAMSAIDQMIARQQATLDSQPKGVLSNVDPVMLGLAQGLLSPTKTGGFGESVGLGIAGAEGPLAAMKKQQLDAQGKIQELQLARAKLAMEAPYYQARAAHLAGLGSGGGSGSSMAAESVTLNRAWTMLNNNDPEDLGMTDEQYAEAKKNVSQRLIELSQRGAKGSAASGAIPGASTDGTAAPASSGGVPEVKSEADYGKIGPGERFMYKGKLYQKPEAPADQPRG